MNDLGDAVVMSFYAMFLIGWGVASVVNWLLRIGVRNGLFNWWQVGGAVIFFALGLMVMGWFNE